jgi:hypothetical protein
MNVRKAPARKPLKKISAAKQQPTVKKVTQTGKHLKYKMNKDGTLHLFDGLTDTGIAVKRSHEGYNHFACWYVTDNGKIKKDYPLKEKNVALSKGISLYLEKLTDVILKKHGGKNG